MTDSKFVPREMFIDGAWSPSADRARIDVINPATEETIDSIPRATAGDLDRALAAADRAWRSWREVDAWSRSAVLRRAAALVRERLETIATVMTEEQGKPLAESRAEVNAAADHLDWNADEARRIYGRTVEARSRESRLLVAREPIGPVAAFTAWNFPVLLAARKIAPALAAGCSMILKPAEEAPRAAFALAKAFEDAGLPAGVLSVVTGEPAAVSRHLLGSSVVRKATLTGSVPVGREILRLCAERLIPASMELGGHAPVLVFPDADPEAVAETCARGKFRNMGQVCIAATRFAVHESIADRFAARFVEVARGLRIGDGRDPKTEVGPLANRRRLEAVEAFVQDAASQGARVLCGGRRPAERRRGFFYEPTVFDRVGPAARLMREEPFGPLAPIVTFSGFGDAIAFANATEYGLAAYVFTNDLRTAFRASEALEVGMVGVNQLLLSTAEIPFGGVKQSGFGREGGSEGVESYTVTKHVHVRL